ncbi:MAG TPA: hypothetical protein VNZ50_12490 [Hyphomicrobiaceae bacterium]|nr:hypothetical protein [Hyphomicrobiaceae bacterium]
MDHNATREGSLFARPFLAVCAALGLWRRSRSAALAAGKTYENARGAGAPHDIAAGAAFRVLTKEERPELPEVVTAAQSAPAGAADIPDDGIASPCWPAARGSS